MTHTTPTVQPLGIFPPPAHQLLLPPVPNAEEAGASLLRGRPPEVWPAPWRFFALALDGKTEQALAALAQDPSPVSRYNRFALDPSPEAYETLAPTLAGELRELLDAVAYTQGILDEPPRPQATQAERRAFVLMAQAAHRLESQRFPEAVALLTEAVEAARPTSPLLAGQLLAALADARLAWQGPDAQALLHYREALSLIPEDALPQVRAEMALNLGILYQEMAQGRRGPLLEAARCYQTALLTLTREEQPELYALAHNNLALAYLAMPMTTASDRLRMAIAVQSLREALKVYDRSTHPEAWASAQLNLANALQHLPSAHPRENLAQAVELYEELLAVRDPERDPLGYARLLANQGNALAHLGIFVHAVSKLTQALALFHQHGELDAAAAVQETLAEIQARNGHSAPAPPTGSAD